MMLEGHDESFNENPKANGEVSLGTTIMAIRFDHGVVMAADSRTTTGSFIANRVTDKIYKVTDNIYCCRSGSAADTQAISDIVKANLTVHSLELGQPPAVNTAAKVFRSMCYKYRDQLSAGIIVGGVDSTGPHVYSIPLGGSVVEQPFSIGGSGSTYIYGYCDAHYRPGMSKEECIEFAKSCVALAMSRDGSSGGLIRLAVITPDGVERQVVTGIEQ
ncbi:Proteasome, subunit alpha/beta [Carpediemonas membranifera]|uniref:Proteasome subunit beta n=1 Tax=Carpediemonas membranifera TaxID=201153 RepID=A0A8J6DYD5_9EUKA|nr:Proteasome, subunit alpha/beta [Carpediemonas membranifera]|eukprot:KAG9392049.1 Proteasome, subunit alpha/beta [Carpediemonas membranifera]